MIKSIWNVNLVKKRSLEVKIETILFHKLHWICDKIRWDKIEITILKSVEITLIVEKMIKNRLKWFKHENTRLINYVVRRVEQIKKPNNLR